MKPKEMTVWSAEVGGSEYGTKCPVCECPLKVFVPPIYDTDEVPSVGVTCGGCRSRISVAFKWIQKPKSVSKKGNKNYEEEFNNSTSVVYWPEFFVPYNGRNRCSD